MEIRFISSLTAEDEDAYAPAVLKAVGALLDQLPIAYTLRIETSGARVYQHTRVMPDTASQVQSDPPPMGPRPIHSSTSFVRRAFVGRIRNRSGTR
jgi:hypothetical protein